MNLRERLRERYDCAEGFGILFLDLATIELIVMILLFCTGFMR